jgi:NAD(P)-dependent dehydrogenase (short-subunit alcohol dehydrogenase family)
MHFIQTNVAREEDWEQLMENTLAKWGRVDILVNNAGTSYKNKVNPLLQLLISIRSSFRQRESRIQRALLTDSQPTVEVTEDEFDKVFAVNVKSIFHSARHFIPNLINQGEGGSIINIASIGATRPRPGLVWYNASKAAVANVCSPPSLQIKALRTRN